MSRTAALRVSILVSMGLVPIACGGTTLRSGEEGEAGAGTGNGGSGSDSSAGSSTLGGKPSPGGAGGRAGNAAKAGSSSGGTTVASGGAPGRLPCTNGKLDPLTGLLRCAEGYSSRPKAVGCEVPALGAGGAAGEGPASLPRAEGENCNVDEDCAGISLGYCEQHSGACDGGIGGQAGLCQSGCASDADCGTGSICLCDGSAHGGVCIPSKCKIDADCGPGSVCASLQSYGNFAFFCTSSADECATERDCRAGQACEVSGGRRQCFDLAVCGRPFLVENQPRLAPVAHDGAWVTAPARSPRVEHLSPTERSTLAAHWSRLGQMEHASIAAFARFSLQLLALGAPPALVEACTRALADETAHTQLCFGLASAYAGRTIGPGPLDVSHSLEASSLADIVDLVILEGCFGETSAALAALEAADTATDPVIAAAYAQIGVDEQRHAELAFAFVRWALQEDPAAVGERIAAALNSSLARSHAAREVTVPCLQALPHSLPS